MTQAGNGCHITAYNFFLGSAGASRGLMYQKANTGQLVNNP